MRTGIAKCRNLVIFLMVLTLMSAVTVGALSWEGSSSGGGGKGDPANANGFAIRLTGDNCIGYRFSIVDKSGNMKVTKVIDVFRNTTYGNYEYTNAYKFTSKYNKKQLINNQNNNFSTSKTTTNCYKEANMGFATSLPTPNQMGTWQNNANNLNAVLSALNAGNLSGLKNGDKIIVEPLYDVRLQTVYHSITTTEIAIYGKWLLGANSNGGSSGNANSWGFISAYTNRHYPNSLYTPNGQGLWTGASAVGSSSRATFYNIINRGYGVGIAYTETKPDFSPSLSVRVCEAWKGSRSSRTFHYGTSNGAAWGNFTHANDYPILNDTVWFAVYFPAESENTYVRQTVWVVGGGSTSRNVYSNTNTWYDVALSPTKVDANRSSYTVKARADWINSSGTVLKWGAEKTFYIPVRPKINRYQVTLTDVAGKTTAYGGSGGFSGKVYVGQRVYPQYRFTSDNTWTSYNTLTGSLYAWENASWKRLYGAPDMAISGAGIHQYSDYSGYSSLYPYRVPDNSANTNGSNRIPFDLASSWSSDTRSTYQNTWINIPIIKADVELYDIRLIDASGYYVTGSNVYANETVTPQYLYRNNSDCTVYVQGYDNDMTSISGIYSIPPNATIAVNGKPIRIKSTGLFLVWGGVYLEGADRSTSWESNGSNNSWTKGWTIVQPLTIQPIYPNSIYREGVTVVTSFMVTNAAYTDVIPNNGIAMRFSVLKGATMLYSAYQNTIAVPSNSSNLVYFKWQVPSGLSGGDLTIRGEIMDNEQATHTSQMTVTSGTVINSQTPDTQYERSRPSGWSPSLPTSYSNSAVWSEWVYQNNTFEKKTYGIQVSSYSNARIYPDNNAPSYGYIDDAYTVKSGYGFSLFYYPYETLVSGTINPNSSAYTTFQNANVLLPEYNYSSIADKYRTLQMVHGHFYLPINPVADGGRIHYIPVWYPNGRKNYTVDCYAYDMWTPAGMLAARTSSNSFTIDGSLFDDYYIGRN